MQTALKLLQPLRRCMSTTASATAKRKMAPKVGTHSGSFHADEALGCALLQKTSKFAGASVVRSRDPAVLADCDVVIDVGGVYDPGAPGHPECCLA